MSRALAVIAAPELDLALTLGCGQVFHWRRHGEGWFGMIGDVPCYAEQRGDTLLVPRGMEKIAAHYFALDHPLEQMRATFPDDPAMNAAAAACRGLRLVRQPHWECLATFITSAQKAVAHIAQISHTLRERYGRAVEWNGERLFSYPTPSALAALEEKDLRACALGYRAKNLLRTARMVAAAEVNLEAVSRLGDDEASLELQRLAGVGPKVAACALLFGFGRLAAFPIDVWIERILRGIYFARKRKVTTKRLREFSASYFGAYGGYAQQYLFHHARTTTPRGKKSR
ncbi:MAG: DNA glycosylase [Chthoniobacteraceae bacterium]